MQVHRRIDIETLSGFKIFKALSFTLICVISAAAASQTQSSPTTPPAAPAPTTADVQADQKTDVIMFGGWSSTNAQMQAWEKSAAEDSKRKADFNFKAVALPSRHFDQLRVLRDSESTIRAWVDKIMKAPPTKKFVITGHSSGSAISNEIMRRVERAGRDPATLKLVILDGFAPGGVSERIEVQCVSAVDADRPEKKTWNQRAMKSCNSPNHRYRESGVKGCTHVMCLHFSTINVDAPKAGISSRNFKLTGYKAVRANLDWLDPAPAAGESTRAPAPVVAPAAK